MIDRTCFHGSFFYIILVQIDFIVFIHRSEKPIEKTYLVFVNNYRSVRKYYPCVGLKKTFSQTVQFTSALALFLFQFAQDNL